jgi:hypothetical protein
MEFRMPRYPVDTSTAKPSQTSELEQLSLGDFSPTAEVIQDSNES